MSDEHNGNGAPSVLQFQGGTGVEFLENLAHALAGSLTFEGHGNLTSDEQKAFLWGFRHGVHHMHGMLNASAEQSPHAFGLIKEMLDEAAEAWDIGVKVSVLVAETRSDETAEETPGETRH